MQKFEDVKEIFSAVRELGEGWRNEIISLREKNSQLEKENSQLQKNYSALEKKFTELKNDFNNLSETTAQLTRNVSDEIIKEMNVKNREEFQKFVEDYLKQIRKCVESSLQTAGAVQPADAQTNYSENTQDNDGPNY